MVLLDHQEVVMSVMDGWAVERACLWVRRVLAANLDTAYGRELFVRKAAHTGTSSTAPTA